MQYSLLKQSCSTVQYVQYSAVQYSAVQCSAVRWSVWQCSIVQCRTVQYSAVQCRAVQQYCSVFSPQPRAFVFGGNLAALTWRGWNTSGGIWNNLKLLKENQTDTMIILDFLCETYCYFIDYAFVVGKTMSQKILLCQTPIFFVCFWINFIEQYIMIEKRFCF